MKKLLLTLLCIVAAVCPALADVTYEPVSVSDLSTGDEVAMVGSKDGTLYFATPTINTSSQLTCISVAGNATESVSLTDDQNGQVQKFIVTKNGSTISLKKSDSSDYITTKSTPGIGWGAQQDFNIINAPNGGVFLGGPKYGFGLYNNSTYIYTGSVSMVQYFCTGLFFFKPGKADAPAKQDITIVPAINLISLQMEDGKTVTGNLPAINAYLNYGTMDQEKLTDDLKYTYTAVEAEGSDTATDVISVDENGVVTALKAGDVYVKVELVSDKYAAAPTYVNVVVKAVAEVSTYTGTKFTAGENSAFYLTVAGSTTHLLDLENGASATYTLSAGKTYYVYAAENREITNFTVDGANGTMWYNDFGYFSVKAGSEPKDVVVNTTEPRDPRTKFVVSGDGTVEIWYQNAAYQPTYLCTLEPDADGVAYVELPENGGRDYYIAASKKSLLTEVSFGTTTITSIPYEYAPMPSNYYWFKDTKLEYKVTSVFNDVTTITFNIPTTDRALLKDSEGNQVTTIGNSWQTSFTQKLNPDKTYYIYNQAGYELKSVKASNGEELTIEQTADGEQRAAFTVGAEDVTYTIECPALPKEPAKFIFPNGRNVSIYTYNQPRTLVVNFEEEEDVNTFDFDGAAASYYYIVANEGYELESVEVNPTPSSSLPVIKATNLAMADGKTFSSWCYMYKSWDPRSVTITVKKTVEPVKVEFEVAEGGKVYLMHQNGSSWVTDETFSAQNSAVSKNADLTPDTQYFIMADKDYKLTEVTGDDGEAMTIIAHEEFLPATVNNYVTFNSDEAPSKISVTAVENKIEVNPFEIYSGMNATFDFTKPETLNGIGTPSNNQYTISADSKITMNNCPVELKIADRPAYIPYDSKGATYYFNLAAPTTWGTPKPGGAFTVGFNNLASSIEKIELEYYSNPDNYINTVALTCNAGELNSDATVWTPGETACSQVTFTASAGASNLKALKITYTGIPTGIEAIDASAANVEAVYYNLQGVRVENPAAGIYVRVQGNKVDKVLVK